MIDDFGAGKSRKKHIQIPVTNKAATPEPVSEEPKIAEQVTDNTPAETTVDTPPEQLTDKPAKEDIPKPKTRRQRLKEKWQSLSKRKKIVCVIVAVLLLSAIVTGTTLALLHKPPIKVVLKQAIPMKIAPKPVIITSDLTGLPVADASVNQRPVTAVMIENSDGARPQSGLDQAGVVFEAVAEAGITRFMALYQDTQPSYLGPVRSVRPYYIEWAMGFDAAIAHVGGSPEALSDMSTWGVRNLDEFYNGGAYERISSRAAPHNVYTSATQLNTLETGKGFTSSTFSGFVRKADSPSKTANAASIDISPSSADYASHYDYDASTNTYKRSEGGTPHREVDASGNSTQITPKVVIAMVVPQSLGSLDSSGAYYTEYATIGSGQVSIFQDGTVTTGTWQKTGNTSQITFTNAAGQTIKLNAGQTWITAVGSASDITYK